MVGFPCCRRPAADGDACSDSACTNSASWELLRGNYKLVHLRKEGHKEERFVP